MVELQLRLYKKVVTVMLVRLQLASENVSNSTL